MKKSETTDIVTINEYPDTITVKCEAPWYMCLWRFISNPFTYLFLGKIRY
jgi:hypothetical protein